MIDIIEEWRPVVGYEGLYEISNTGKVINIKTGHILKQHKDKDGYWVLSLKRDKYKTYFAHRLVAQAFIPNPDNLPVVSVLKISPGLALYVCENRDLMVCIAPAKSFIVLLSEIIFLPPLLSYNHNKCISLRAIIPHSNTSISYFLAR